MKLIQQFYYIGFYIDYVGRKIFTKLCTKRLGHRFELDVE